MASASLLNPSELKRIHQEFLSALNSNPNVFAQQAYKSLNLFFTNNPLLCSAVDHSQTYLEKKVGANPYITYSATPPTAINNLSNNSQQLARCGGADLTQLRFIGSDPFTNETIISYCLEDLALPTLSLAQLGFLCNNSGYLLYPAGGIPLSEFGSDTELEFLLTGGQIDTEFLFDIFNQVLLTVDHLQSIYSFTHGALTTENILIVPRPVNYSSSALALSASFTCQITNFSSAAITIPLGLDRAKHRIYSLGDNPRSTQILWWTIFNPQVTLYQNEYYYVIENVTVETVIAQLRHMGIPFYYSFDVYTFIISLLMSPPIYSTFFSDPFYSEMWRLMWFDNDDKIMFERIAAFHASGQKRSYETIVKLLMNIRLKCKLTSTLIRFLQGR